MNANINRFFRESGLKVLAISNLNACEYSILFYLLNCAMSGLDSLVSNEAELGSIIGHSPLDVRSSLEHMAGRGIVKANYGDGTQSPKLQSVRLGMNWDIAKWKLMENSEMTPLDHHQAIIFPFRRGAPTLQILSGKRHEKQGAERPTIHKSHAEIESSQRIFETFSRGRDMDEHEHKTTQIVAKALAEAHPIDQILVLVRHFAMRIPTLSLLASNWEHYTEQYEQENQRLDLFEIRQKQTELDQRARDAASSVLEKRQDLQLSDEETQVLELLAQHRHPRRQLFWAYQQRIRYPKLNNFFAEHIGLMLPITHSGQVVKGPTD